MTAETNPKPRRNWGRIALVISLGVNLLIVGLVAGAMLHGPRDRGGNPGPRDLGRELGLGPFVQALPGADRRAIGDAFRREAGAFRANREEMRALFESLLAALRAEPYDSDALRNLVEEQAAKVNERQALGRKLLLERIEAMSPAQRAKYADALDKSLRRGPPRGD